MATLACNHSLFPSPFLSPPLSTYPVIQNPLSLACSLLSVGIGTPCPVTWLLNLAMPRAIFVPARLYKVGSIIHRTAPLYPNSYHEFQLKVEDSCLG